jgi:hypothetical protein
MSSTYGSRRNGTCVLAALAGLAMTVVVVAGAGAQCIGDCNNDDAVAVDDLLVMVNVAQGAADVSACPKGDADGSNDITIDEILLAVNSALLGCTPVATPTATMPAGACEQPTPRPTAPPPAGCGDGQFEVGETCDDGNTTEDDITVGTDVDRCPFNCHIVSCGGAQSTVNVDVNLCVPEGTDAGGATVFLRYPDGTVGIPGSGNSGQVFKRIQNILEDPFISLTPNDLDYALRTLVFAVDLVPIPAGRLFTVQFDVCSGATAPSAEDFRCVVKDASDPNGAPISGVSCSVSIQ